MKIKQCDRCKTIIQDNEECFSYDFTHQQDRYCSLHYLIGDLCPKCYDAFKRFLRVENTYGTN